jgi:hypothetical protein
VEKYKNVKFSPAKRAEDLLSRMSIKEKMGLLPGILPRKGHRQLQMYYWGITIREESCRYL